MDYSYKTTTWVDTLNYDGLTYQDYKEYCEEEGIEAGAEDSTEFYGWLNKETEINREDFFANLKYSKNVNEYPCYIIGHLGLWWGNPEIKGVICDTLTEAIHKCMDGAQDIEIISDNDGEVTVKGHHHDGTNVFYIRPLTKEGIKEYETNGEYAVITNDDLGNYPFYLY